VAEMRGRPVLTGDWFKKLLKLKDLKIGMQIMGMIRAAINFFEQKLLQ